MEQHHTPSPSIASLLNPIPPYHSPSSPPPPPQNKTKRSLKRPRAEDTNNTSSQELDQSMLFNPNPSQSMLNLVENHPNHISHQPPPTNTNKKSSSHQSTSTAAATTLPSTTIETNLEHSIFGIAPYDQFTWTIAQFIWQHARQYWEKGQAHLVEVEAKLGTIRDKKNHGERMYYPIGTESPILETRDIKFQSDITIQKHENLNHLLNQRVTESNSIGYPGSKVEYSHLKQVDEFYDSQVRVSRDWNGTNASANQSTPRAIIKEKIAHLNIHCPGRQFDFRISVNVEQPVPLPHRNSTPKFHRIKDRLSYSHQICQIDLTQVKSSEKTSTHEVEVEFKNPQELLKAASIWAESQNPNTNTNNKNQNQEKNSNQNEQEGLFGDEEEEDSDNEELEEVEIEGGSRPNTSNGLIKRNKKIQSNHVVIDSNHYLLMVEVLLNNIRMLILNC